MIIRATDDVGDWTFGQGVSNYKNNLPALLQWVREVLQIWFNDLFYRVDSGIDWLNLLTGQFGDDPETLAFIRQDVAITITRQQRYGIVGITKLEVVYNRFVREVRLTYQLDTVYGPTPDINLILEYYGNV